MQTACKPLILLDFDRSYNYIPSSLRGRKWLRIERNSKKDTATDQRRSEVKANLIKVFEYLSHAKNPNMAEVEEMTIGLMKRVIEKSNTFDAAGYEAYAGVRSYLRETGVSLSEDQKLEAAVLSDTYGAYRASVFGCARFRVAGAKRAAAGSARKTRTCPDGEIKKGCRAIFGSSGELPVCGNERRRIWVRFGNGTF